MIKSLIILMIVGVFATVSFAQSNNKRIQFAKGKNSIVEKFTIPANDGITYIFSAKQFNLVKYTLGGLYTDGTEGQGLQIKLTKTGGKKILVESAPGESVEHQIQTGNGDYVITVMNPGPRKAKITLNFSINK